MKKCIPLTFEEHEEIAKDLKSAQEILEPWLEKLWGAYGVKCKEAQHMHKVLNLVSSKICNELDNRWWEKQGSTYSDSKYWGKNSPYYGKGKKAY